jgi:GNAT superfamily N-acetyltransferase
VAVLLSLAIWSGIWPLSESALFRRQLLVIINLGNEL